VGGEVAEHHIPGQTGVAAQDLAVSLDDHHLTADLLLFLATRSLKKPRVTSMVDTP
jgi:hypothetical protein